MWNSFGNKLNELQHKVRRKQRPTEWKRKEMRVNLFLLSSKSRICYLWKSIEICVTYIYHTCLWCDNIESFLNFSCIGPAPSGQRIFSSDDNFNYRLDSPLFLLCKLHDGSFRMAHAMAKKNLSILCPFSLDRFAMMDDEPFSRPHFRSTKFSCLMKSWYGFITHIYPVIN